jgi:hypothetical protein
MSDPSDINLPYPSPSIVVGLGKLGLAVLERLGEDWETLQQAGGGASLKNLRLVHVRADAEVPDARWRDGERQYVEIARYTGDGDLPTLALDFVMLRSLGLVRYRNGTYQVAMPRDQGVIEIPGRQVAGRAVEDEFARRRYFEWKALSPDPITSVERLRALKAREPAFDLFVSPLVNRVRQGHSPRAVLACISRCRALAEGRDPWPWVWLFSRLTDAQSQRESEREPFREIPLVRDWLRPNDVRGFLDGFADEPVAGWKDWVRELQSGGEDPDLGAVELPDVFSLTLPEPFLPKASDLSAPIHPFELLRVDWQATGWATREVQRSESVQFDPVDVSPFRLGLFDHDDCSRIHQTHGERFRGRLRELAVHAHRGLVRMWVDLQRERVEVSEEQVGSSRHRANADDSLDQSLEVLGELLVRPLLSDRFQSDDGESNEAVSDEVESGEAELGDVDLAADPSAFLRSLIVEEAAPENAVQHALNARLAELGFDPPTEPEAPQTLFREVALRPGDITHEPDKTSIIDPDALNQRSAGLLELRELLNEHTRRLYDFGFLKEYRKKPSRRVPRLTVYVVGDAGEAFARSSMRTVLREVHAELLRAYGPIFETFREGFDRALAVVPIIWMPHPADTFGGKHPLANRGEEAAIIESIQGVRRWVESVPSGKRCIPQVIINSRVTDNAVLSAPDSVRQTRDYLNFQMRNDLAGDAWLRKTATAARGDDLFASFSCHQIAFPAEKAREYLANRYARHSLERLRTGEQGALPRVDAEPIEPPQIAELVREPQSSLAGETGRAAEAMAGRVRGRVEVGAATGVEQVERLFDRDFEEELRARIHEEWRSFTRRRGQMDDMVDALRRDTSAHLGRTLGVVKKAGDRLIAEHAGKGGLKRAWAGFAELHAIARDHLRERESTRRRTEEVCLKHRIPSTEALSSTREGVLDAARRKPDWSAMKVGLIIWAVMSPVLGAPIAWAVAKAFDLHLNPNVAEFILGPLGPLVGALLVFGPVFWLLRRHMNARVERLREAIEAMSEAARRVVDGGEDALSSAPSIRSFMQARLVHTGALATRDYARQVYERVLQDLEHAGRLRRSVDLQHDLLTRRAENLGVQFSMVDVDDLEEVDGPSDDVSRLFDSRGGMPADALIAPENLVEYYRRHVGGAREIDEMLERFIKDVDGFEHWRKVASLSDTARIMEYARAQFGEVASEPIGRQFDFEQEVRERLMAFVLANYSNIGFGAKFSGYEGLDPNGIRVIARTALVLHPGLEPLFEQACKAPDAPAPLQSMHVQTARVQPNAAYMLSLVQGIRPHSLRNLRRFESFHHRAQMPDDRTFPLSGESRKSWESAPINHLTGYESLRHSINHGLFEIARRVESQTEQAEDFAVGSADSAEQGASDE